MAATDGLLFIDTHQYLYFYKVIKGKRLLELLMEQREHIFVTQQIVEEVQRNKLQNAKTFLDEHFKNWLFAWSSGWKLTFSKGWQHAGQYLKFQVFFVAQSVCASLDDANLVVQPLDEAQ